ncbi:hypothetical protein WJX73_002144 [Symbiochloris irregularis]|uniref:Uncharacterized protein n=1 Tax=Symbiochloris irregularis TaxID=706552 RepID=A0AAW1NVH2_9CHLO
MSASTGFDFTGQRVLVVGGSSGIGLATAKLFASLGAKVIVASSSKDKLDAATKAIGHGATGIVTDATDDAQVQSLFEQTGELDHIISSSGRAFDKPFLEATPEQLFEPWKQKYWVYVRVARFGAPKLKKGGSITVVGGLNGTRPNPNSHQAAAVNGAVEAFARALSLDLSPTRVNVVSPGTIGDTGLWQRSHPDDEKRRELFEKQAARLPSKTVGTSEEVARIIAAIASSPFTTGSVFDVNGGAFLV